MHIPDMLIFDIIIIEINHINSQLMLKQCNISCHKVELLNENIMWSINILPLA